MTRRTRLCMLIGPVGAIMLWTMGTALAAQPSPKQSKPAHHKTLPAHPRISHAPAVTAAAKTASLIVLNTILNDITPCSQQYHFWFDGYDPSMDGTDTTATSYKAKTVDGLCGQALTALKGVVVSPKLYQHDLLQKVLGEELTVAHEYQSAAAAITYLAAAYSDVAAGMYSTSMTVISGIEPSLIADVNQLRADLQQ